MLEQAKTQSCNAEEKEEEQEQEEEEKDRRTGKGRRGKEKGYTKNIDDSSGTFKHLYLLKFELY
jgi:hypothetical protein